MGVKSGVPQGQASTVHTRTDVLIPKSPLVLALFYLTPHLTIRGYTVKDNHDTAFPIDFKMFVFCIYIAS